MSERQQDKEREEEREGGRKTETEGERFIFVLVRSTTSLSIPPGSGFTVGQRQLINNTSLGSGMLEIPGPL